MLIPKVIFGFMNRNMRIGDARPSWFLACFALLFLGLLSLQSCKKEYFETDRIKDATWNPELAVPLIKSTITVQEVLSRFDDQEIIVIDTTGILALRYFSNVFSIAADSLIPISNQFNTQSHTLTATEALGLATTSLTLPISYDIAFNVSNINPTPELHSLVFKTGNLNLDITSSMNNTASGTITIPSLVDPGGSAFTIPFSNVTAGTPTTISRNLAGYTLDLTNPSGPAPHFNTVHVDANVTINAGPAAPGQSFDVTSRVTNIGFSEIVGDLKQQQLAVNAGQVRIRFFENDSAGTIHWDDPRVKGIFTNGIGASAAANVSQLDFAGLLGTTSMADGQFQNNPLLHQPTINSSSTIGVLTQTEYDVNRNNSNIVQIADEKPTMLHYSFDAILNPQGGANINWLLDTSKVRLDMEVYLPFDGSARDFRRSDVADVDIFPLDGDIQEIESVTLRLTIDNGFPADAHGQVIFGDSTLDVDSLTKKIVGTRIDSLFPSGRAVVFASPDVPTSAPFHVDQSNKRRTTLDITLDRDMLEKLEAQGFKRIVAQGWIDTYQLGTQRVRIYEDYAMDLYLGIMVKAKVKVNP
jgi:hypothetical protein